MSSLRNTLKLGVAALALGSAAGTFIPTTASAFSFGGLGHIGGMGGFGHSGGLGHISALHGANEFHGMTAGRKVLSHRNQTLRFDNTASGKIASSKTDHGTTSAKEADAKPKQNQADNPPSTQKQKQATTDNSLPSPQTTAAAVARGTPFADDDNNHKFGLGIDIDKHSFGSNRAFVEWAGITAGITESFYDFYSVPGIAYTPDVGASGRWTVPYTAELGNGLTATIAAEALPSTPSVPSAGGTTPDKTAFNKTASRNTDKTDSKSANTGSGTTANSDRPVGGGMYEKAGTGAAANGDGTRTGTVGGKDGTPVSSAKTDQPPNNGGVNAGANNGPRFADARIYRLPSGSLVVLYDDNGTPSAHVFDPDKQNPPLRFVPRKPRPRKVMALYDPETNQTHVREWINGVPQDKVEAGNTTGKY